MGMISPRLSSAMRYLGWADIPYKWRFSKGECPLCNKSVFLSFRRDPFMTRCLKCRTNITNLALITAIKKFFKAPYTGKSAYELSSYGCTLAWLRSHWPTVVASEYFPGKKPGSVIDGVLNQDVQQLTFENESFDLVTSNQVFEHVPDDILGYAECFRVLRQDGALIFSVPLYDTDRTARIAFLDQGNIVFCGNPEYHDSRLAGANSVPVFWRHSSRDIVERVKTAGFRKVELMDVFLAGAQNIPSKVVCAWK
ncbi:class I SAM-dependent methyltransferase [Sulfuriferula sp. GW1]|uniref:class I SAM-dependent methyltransferase n=1 Tax=Sulfuriferula sp. GW1 TaxID=3345111 RepID=UPI0039AF0C20